MRPLSRLSTICCSRTDPRPQVVPVWPSDEPVPVQVRSGVSEFFQATTQFFFNCELVGHAGCNNREPLVNHVQRVCP